MGCEVELTSRPRTPRTSFSTAHKIAIDFEQPLHFAQNIAPVFVLVAIKMSQSHMCLIKCIN